MMLPGVLTMVYIETTPSIAMYTHALLGEPSQCKSALGRLTSTQHHGPAANHGHGWIFWMLFTSREKLDNIVDILDDNFIIIYMSSHSAIDKNPALSMHVVNLIYHKLSSKAGHISWHKFESDSDVVKLVITCSWGRCPSFRDTVRL